MKRQIRKLLVANRGEIAVRIMRTCRDMGIRTAAMFADSDRTAMHVHSADEAYPLKGASARETYLDQNKILEIARRSGSDAIHPGYGFLSENPVFAKAVEEAGLAFVGPSSEAIALLGDKTAARALALRLGIPTVEGTHEAFADAGQALESVQRLQFPLLLKAAAGGGGKGMRIVQSRDEFASAFKLASSEAQKAFGDPRMYVERYLVNPHHVEVQILGDKSGRVVSFPERDCSLQRRHQKLVEESPSPVVNSALRERIMSVAAQLAAAAGYRNAGTVEFLVDESGNFYFLEVNTRLQVEHPVTEAVTGLDFVREQIMLAEGHSLAIRQEEIPLRGHALECRIYAEDPANDFFPSIGRILAFEPPSGPGIRVDTGVRTDDAVDVHFDPLLAKVIAHGSNRSEAIQRMVRALREFGVSGIHTTVPFCKYIIQSEIFLQAKHTTQLINQELLHVYLTLSVKPQEFAAASVAAILFARESKPGETKATATVTPNGWRKRRTEYYE